MLSDKQSLLLCGITAGGIFVGGILDVLTNFIVLTILTIVFFTVIANLMYTKLNQANAVEKEIGTDNYDEKESV